MKDRKFDVIIIAGQSNAEGNGMRKPEEGEIINSKVIHMIDKNPYFYAKNEEGVEMLNLTLPVETVIEVAHERKAGDMVAADFSETFADCYIRAGMLEEGRDILIVKTAIGGAGFARKQWGVGNPVSDRFFAMVDEALSLNKDNRIVALLWHQGEHDAFENDGISKRERYDFYRENFYNQMKAARDRYSDFNFPIIAGQFVKTWQWGLVKDNAERIEAIYSATEDALNALGYSGYVNSDGLTSNDTDIKNGDDIHFSAKSVRELGKRYFKVYEELVRGDK